MHEREACLFRGMLQDLSHLGAHGSHGPLLQLPELAGVRTGISVLGVTSHIPAQVALVHFYMSHCLVAITALQAGTKQKCLLQVMP